MRFDVCLVDHLHVCRFARTRDDFCKTDGDDDFRSSNGNGEGGRQGEWVRTQCLRLDGTTRVAECTDGARCLETECHRVLRPDAAGFDPGDPPHDKSPSLSTVAHRLTDYAERRDRLIEVTLKPDGGFTSEQMEAIAKLAEEAMGCVLSVLDPEMYDAVQRDCPEKKLGREARAVRILTLFDETPQKKLAAVDTADLLRRRLSFHETVAVPLLLATNRGAAA